MSGVHHHCGRFKIVQPWGADKARQSTVVSEHESADEAFHEIERLAYEMVRRGVPSDAVELIVVERGRIVQRAGIH